MVFTVTGSEPEWYPVRDLWPLCWQRTPPSSKIRNKGIYFVHLSSRDTQSQESLKLFWHFLAFNVVGFFLNYYFVQQHKPSKSSFISIIISSSVEHLYCTGSQSFVYVSKLHFFKSTLPTVALCWDEALENLHKVTSFELTTSPSTGNPQSSSIKQLKLVVFHAICSCMTDKKVINT